MARHYLSPQLCPRPNHLQRHPEMPESPPTPPGTRLQLQENPAVLPQCSLGVAGACHVSRATTFLLGASSAWAPTQPSFFFSSSKWWFSPFFLFPSSSRTTTAILSNLVPTGTSRHLSQDEPGLSFTIGHPGGEELLHLPPAVVFTGDNLVQ